MLPRAKGLFHQGLHVTLKLQSNSLLDSLDNRHTMLLWCSSLSAGLMDHGRLGASFSMGFAR